MLKIRPLVGSDTSWSVDGMIRLPPSEVMGMRQSRFVGSIHPLPIISPSNSISTPSTKPPASHISATETRLCALYGTRNPRRICCGQCSSISSIVFVVVMPPPSVMPSVLSCSWIFAILQSVFRPRSVSEAPESTSAVHFSWLGGLVQPESIVSQSSSLLFKLLISPIDSTGSHRHLPLGRLPHPLLFLLPLIISWRVASLRCPSFFRLHVLLLCPTRNLYLQDQQYAFGSHHGVTFSYRCPRLTQPRVLHMIFRVCHRLVVCWLQGCSNARSPPSTSNFRGSNAHSFKSAFQEYLLWFSGHCDIVEHLSYRSNNFSVALRSASTGIAFVHMPLSSASILLRSPTSLRASQKYFFAFFHV